MKIIESLVYCNGQFVRERFDEKKEVKQIGEILYNPTFEEVVLDDNLKEMFVMLIQKIKAGSRINLLFSGQQGTGKTLCCKMLACETGKPFVYMNGNMSKDKIIEILSNSDNCIVLIDEVHGIRDNVAEVIYPAIQDDELYINGKRIKLNCLFVATTTEPEKLPKPLLDRFQRIEFEEFSREKLKEVLDKICPAISDKLLDFSLNFRILKGLMEMIKIYGDYNEDNLKKVFRLKKIGDNGYSDVQNKYLSILTNSTKPLGLRSLALQLRKSEDYIKGEIEPDLIRKEIVIITSKGRELVRNTKIVQIAQKDEIVHLAHLEPKVTRVDLDFARAWLKDRKGITDKLGSRYLELVNTIAEIIARGDMPDNYDFGSFSDDIPIKESIENNYLCDL